MTPTRWIGHWWLPNDPEDKQPGVLHREDDGRLNLEMVGGFNLMRKTAADTNQLEWVSPGAKQTPMVVGSTNNGPVTLLDCYETLSNIKITGAGLRPEFQVMFANSALFGVGLDQADEPVFRSLHLEIENLAHWLSPFKPGIDIEDDGQVARLGHQDPAIEVEFDGLLFGAYLRTVSFHPYRTSNKTAVQTVSTGVIRITSPTPTSLDKLDRYSKRFLNLLTVASGKASGLIKEELDRDLVDGYSATLYKRLAYEPSPDRELTVCPSFLFTCEDLPVDEMMSRWLELSTRTAPAIDVLLGQVFSSESYLQEKAMQVAIAAETFHTKLYDHPARPQEEFDELLRSMLSGLSDPADQQYIASRFSNTLSFANRMRELLTKPDQRAVAKLIPNRKAWLGALKGSRNGIVHGGGDMPRTLNDWQILIRETAMLSFLVLMQEIGISGDRQLKAIEDEQLLRILRGRR